MTKPTAKLGTIYPVGAHIAINDGGKFKTIITVTDTPNQIETVIDQIRRSGRKGKGAELWVLHQLDGKEYIGTRAAKRECINSALALPSLPKW